MAKRKKHKWSDFDDYFIGKEMTYFYDSKGNQIDSFNNNAIIMAWAEQQIRAEKIKKMM